MLTLDANTLIKTNSSEAATWFLYEIDYADGQTPLRYTSWSDTVTFESHAFTPSAIKHSDLSLSSDGKINDAQVSIGNVDRIIQYYLENYDMLGRPVRVIQVFSGAVGYVETQYAIKGAVAKGDVATFTLSIGIDILRAEVPGRIMRARYCGWRFKDVDCGYSGADTTCSQTMEACKAKNNVNSDGSLRFGAFPGIINERFYF